jgi:ketosteroid isomerase-like protein
MHETEAFHPIRGGALTYDRTNSRIDLKHRQADDAPTTRGSGVHPERGGLMVHWISSLCLLAAAGTAPDLEQVASEVRTAESAFARSMAERNLEAFSEHLAEDAVFFTLEDVQRGKHAVLAAWAPWFEEAQAPFSWQPETVEVLASGELALSSGPVFGADGGRIATFNSIWRREADGKWRVVFDKGCN